MISQHRSHSSRRTADSAFTLVEVMVSVAMAAVLLIALTAAMGLFGTQVSHVTADLDTEMDEVLGEIAGSVRRAWLLEQPSVDRVDISDPLGGVTSYYLSGTDLMVRRPSGAVGTLMADVADVDFDVGTLNRLRDDTQVETYGTVWSRAPAGTPMTIPIWGSPEITETTSPFYDPEYVLGLSMSEDAIALGFMLSDEAPDALDTHPDVEERLVSVELDRVVVPMTHLPVLPPIPVYTAPATGKVEICHRSNQNPLHRMTLKVGSPAVQSHLDHGDYIGPCVTQIDDAGTGSLVVELYEARGPDDARPFGPLLGSVTIPEDALPRSTYQFIGVNETTDVFGDPVFGYETYQGVTLETYHLSKIAYYDSDEYTALTDQAVYGYSSDVGETLDFGVNETGVALSVDPPVTGVPLDLAGMGVVLRPGIAYTLTFRYTGMGLMNFRCIAAPKAEISGVATKFSSDADFVPSAMEVEFSLDGMRSYTQTQSHDVAVRLTTTVEKLDGTVLTSSSVLSSQSAILDEWRGQVPGELPSLELNGQ